MVFGLMLGVFLVLFEMAIDAWRMRRDVASRVRHNGEHE
ncbi:hypothetical protein FM114_06830 [Luteococcus japonicus LSP_Lj1]|uniref:Uncharacterized protein n=1 Tax=Luteococcus japonicus LSP_Lj1 TaxID=1255658 RepID=A0A1R4JCK9_9ACTN|nr:hypothetical protein FM114_06830 [Luteococcus japonicus LSP_Lj1]